MIGNEEERIRETKKFLNFLIKYGDRDPKGVLENPLVERNLSQWIVKKQTTRSRRT